MSQSENEMKRFGQVELNKTVGTVVLLPERESINWKHKQQTFARLIKENFTRFEPQKVEGRKIMTARGIMMAAQVRLKNSMKVEQIDDFNKDPSRDEYLKN